jgi:hypothetical protein
MAGRGDGLAVPKSPNRTMQTQHEQVTLVPQSGRSPRALVIVALVFPS